MSDRNTTDLAQRGSEQNVTRTSGETQNRASPKALRPLVDVIEDASGVTLYADMPGVSRDKLHLSIDADRLTIEGDVLLDLPEKMESRFAEINVPRYQRTFTLSKDLDGEKANAELKNGVLKLHIPKAAHAQPRRIQINA